MEVTGAAYFFEIIRGPITCTWFYGRRDAFHNVVVWRSGNWDLPDQPLRARDLLDEIFKAVVECMEGYTHEDA